MHVGLEGVVVAGGSKVVLAARVSVNNHQTNTERGGRRVRNNVVRVDLAADNSDGQIKGELLPGDAVLCEVF